MFKARKKSAILAVIAPNAGPSSKKHVDTATDRQKRQSVEHIACLIDQAEDSNPTQRK